MDAQRAANHMNIFDEAEIRVASLASAPSVYGPIANWSNNQHSADFCCLCVRLRLDLHLGASAAFPVVLNPDDRGSYHDDFGDGNFVRKMACWRPHRLYFSMHDMPMPIIICAPGAVLLDGQERRGRLTAAFSFSTATAWCQVSWGRRRGATGRRQGHGWGGVRVLRVTRGVVPKPVPRKPFCVPLSSHRCCGRTMTCRKEERA